MARIPVLALLSLLIAGCATGGRPEPAARSNDPRLVVNRTWEWVATVTPVEKTTVPNPERYTIRLAGDGKVQARFDCNGGGGTYQISEGKLSFGPLLSTRMACPPGSMDGPFMRDLQRVASFFLQDGELYLELPFDSGSMRFRILNGTPGASLGSELDRKLISLTGTIRFLAHECGFHAIEGENGTT
jgi:heat shock protein HslJ